MSEPLPEIPSPTDGIYFHAPDGKYWREVPSAGWAPFSQDNTKMYLRGKGLSDKAADKSSVTPLEVELLRLQEERSVMYAGPLAGHKAGLHRFNTLQALVTSSPIIIEPGPGDFPVIRALLENMFADTPRQLDFLLGWLKFGYEALRNATHRPGQVVAIAGEPNSGKSVLQKLVFTPLFGGRYVNPYRYMMGKTEFNLDLAGAEHLMIEDAASSTKIEHRRTFGAMAKQFTVNEGQSIHGKGVDAKSMNPLWRVSVTLNREPENLCVLPPLDDSLADKFGLLMAEKKPMPMPVGTLDQRKLFRDAVAGELPAFARWLLEWAPPADMADDRFGVVAFHHPEILAALNANAPEVKLLALIDADEHLLKDENGKWVLDRTCSSEEVEQTLVEGRGRFSAMRLFHWQGACGSYLGKLAASSLYSHRVKGNGHGLARTWTLYPPEAGNEAERKRRDRLRASAAGSTRQDLRS